jgi:outer membrane protein assembly factor BamB
MTTLGSGRRPNNGVGRRSVRVALFTFFAALGMAVHAGAPALGMDVSGWWRADVEHSGEREPIYLHFENGQGLFSVPSVRTYEASLGSYIASSGEVGIPGAAVKLVINGQALDGELPSAFAPMHHLQAHFVRAAPLAEPTSFIPPARPPASAWRVGVGAEIWAGLAYYPPADLLYVSADNGILTAFLGHNGARKWSIDLDSAIRATPTLYRGRLYISTDHALVAIQARSGRRIWSAPFGESQNGRLPITDKNSRWDHYSSSAAISRGVVVVASRDGCIYALTVSRGEQRWRVCTGDLLTSTPAITRGMVYFGGFDGHAHAVSLGDGRERWSTDLHGAVPRDAIVADSNVLFGSRSYDLVALEATTGRQAWDRYFWWSWVDSVPNVVGRTIYIGSSDQMSVQAFDATTGRRAWRTPVPGWAWARVAVDVNAIYAGTVGGVPYIGRREGALVALERGNGALRWMFTPEHSEHTLFGFASAPVVYGGRLFAADLAGTVYAFDVS